MSKNSFFNVKEFLTKEYYVHPLVCEAVRVREREGKERARETETSFRH